MNDKKLTGRETTFTGDSGRHFRRIASIQLDRSAKVNFIPTLVVNLTNTLRLVHMYWVKCSRVDHFNARVKCAQIANSLSYCILRSELCRSEWTFTMFFHKHWSVISWLDYLLNFWPLTAMTKMSKGFKIQSRFKTLPKWKVTKYRQIWSH